jgi:hypothetical protein
MDVKMKNGFALLLSAALVLCSCDKGGQDYSSLNKKQKIELMLEKTGAMKIGMQMGSAMFEQVVHVWQAKGSTLQDSSVSMFKTEFLKGLDSEIKKEGGLKDKLVEVYGKYFDDEEMSDLLRFYDSKSGKKMLEKTPELIKESMALGQAWGMQYGKVIADKVILDLNQKGYSLPQI